MYKIVADSLFTGKKVVHLPICQSTNDTAAELIQSGQAISGTIVVADLQTKGRGQRGNVWHSAAGLNLTISVIWCPAFLRASDSFSLNMAVSLAVADTVAALLPDDVPVSVKWPNDVYADEKKISGILIENILQGVQIKYSIVGIGLNVNQTDFDGIAAVSLKLLTGQQYPLSEVFNRLIVNMEKHYFRLQTQGNAAVKRAYLEKLYRFGQIASYTDLRSDVPLMFRGVIEDVDAVGRLILRTENGFEAFDLKQIRFNP